MLSGTDSNSYYRKTFRLKFSVWKWISGYFSFTLLVSNCVRYFIYSFFFHSYGRCNNGEQEIFTLYICFVRNGLQHAFHTFHLFSFLFWEWLVGYIYSSLVATQCPTETVQSCVVVGTIRWKIPRKMLNFSHNLLSSHSLAQKDFSNGFSSPTMENASREKKYFHRFPYEWLENEKWTLAFMHDKKNFSIIMAKRIQF